MNRLHRHLKTTVFSMLLMGIVFAISCVEVGPVPNFEYSYDFEPSLEVPDTGSLVVETVTITPGEVDNSGAEDFSNDLLDPQTAADYANAVNSVLTQDEQDYWVGQSRSGLSSSISSGDPTTLTEITNGQSAFNSNPILAPMLPALLNAVGSSSRVSGRTSSVTLTEVILSTAATQQQELDDCRQAAEEAFQQAVETVESLYSDHQASIESSFNSKLSQITEQETALIQAAQERHESRIPTYVTLFNTISATITSLFNSSDITARERDLIEMANTLNYGVYHKTSQEMLDSELALIDELIQQVEDNFTTARETLDRTLTNNYNAEINRLTNLRNSSQNACHNQGGVNSN